MTDKLQVGERKQDIENAFSTQRSLIYEKILINVIFENKSS